jgi:prophage maintenance system killer protein
VKITGSTHLPLHHAKVGEAMAQADHDVIERLRSLDNAKGIIVAPDESESALAIDAVITVSAWIHHLVTSVHPFVEGNGRTARLAANLILERYGLVGISIKVEKENKNRYRQALAQIDSHADYEPLKRIIYEGLIDRYEGVDVKYYA